MMTRAGNDGRLYFAEKLAGEPGPAAGREIAPCKSLFQNEFLDLQRVAGSQGATSDCYDEPFRCPSPTT
jgi:hypothetical protein